MHGDHDAVPSLPTRSFPIVTTLNVKGLSAAINTTRAVLSTHCHKLTSLDMSRCINIDGEGIRAMAESALDRGDVLPLKVLRLTQLRGITDGMMHALGCTAPNLEELDRCYAGLPHNSAIEAVVTHPGILRLSSSPRARQVVIPQTPTGTFDG